MAEIERLTITLPSDMAAAIKGAVNGSVTGSLAPARRLSDSWGGNLPPHSQRQRMSARRARDRGREGRHAAILTRADCRFVLRPCGEAEACSV